MANNNQTEQDSEKITSQFSSKFDGLPKISQKIAECEKVIFVKEENGMTFWCKKGDNSYSRDIVELSKLIKDGWRFL